MYGVRSKKHTLKRSQGGECPMTVRGPRRGSALMITVVLIGMLSLIGVLLYTFAAQERSNAAYYADAAKVANSARLNADVLWDFALDQIIVGTDRRLTNSVLWGSRYSMLSNALGYGDHAPGDLHPFNGEGVNLIYDTNGNVAVDQNRNGVPDDGVSINPATGLAEPDFSYLLDFVDSPAAHPGDSDFRQVYNGPKYFPQSDVGYTYPDINNIFLTHVGKTRDTVGNVHNVIKPAYMVPSVLRAPINVGGSFVSAPLTFEDTNLDGVYAASEDINGDGDLDDWTINRKTAARSMRPHRSHIFIPSTGIPAPANQRTRYLTDTEARTLSGNSGAYGFPFHPMAATYNTNTAAGTAFEPGRMGVYSAVSSPDGPIEFDWDNDGDGFKEAILMDLDFPPQQDASGRYFVPLFMVTIHDLDALINLNAHGNLAKILLGPNDVAQATVPVSNVSRPFGSSNTGAFPFFSVSQSNLGLSPSEINPFWALTARFGIDNMDPFGVIDNSAFTPHTKFYGVLPQALGGSNPIWGETANMELAWAKMGRLDFGTGVTATVNDLTDLLPGLYGEENLLYSALNTGTLATPGGGGLPRPGASLVDDNSDVTEGQGNAPFFQHPLDYTGLGSYISPGDVKTVNLLKPTGYTGLVGQQWLTYSNYGSNSTAGASSNVIWGQPTAVTSTSMLMSNTITQGLGDDPSEVLLYAPDTSIDKVFGPEEMLYLSLNNSEIDRLNVSSRLSKLLPFNFSKLSASNQRGFNIRRKFTVESNDRKNFSMPFSDRAYGVPSGIIPATASQEYSADVDPLTGAQSGTRRFPPQFGLVPFTATHPPIPRYQTTALKEDPLRMATRFILEMEENSTQSANRPQRKLSINHLLTGDLNNPLANRQLTPHPIDPGATAISVNIGSFPYPPTTAAGQEFWARYDRQKMARDIYVLLYLLGHGDDTKNTATTSNVGNALYTDLQLREMAQFAVNVVDSMDRDNVMTKFEYDKDLSDGWNLDDNPYGPFGIAAGSPGGDGTWVDPAGVLPSRPYFTKYTTADSNYNPTYPNDGPYRGEVFGIERLDVSISEAMVTQFVRQGTGQADSACTSVDEGATPNDRFFFHVELRNNSPFPVSLGNKEAWQIVLKQEATATIPDGWQRRLTFIDNSIILDNKPGAAQGPLYTIGSGDSATASKPATILRSSFAINPNGTAAPTTAHLVVPNNGTGICDLDLIETALPTTKFRIDNGAPSPSIPTDLTATRGSMLDGFTTLVADMATAVGTMPATVKVQLKRRVNPSRSPNAFGSPADEDDNPWVEVDSMMLSLNNGFVKFDVTSTPDATKADAQLKLTKSRERPQPLDGFSEVVSPGTGVPTILNSLGVDNPLSPVLFNLWQLHFDRDYASLMDLLNVPVFGPHQLTMLARGAYLIPPDQQHVVGTNALPNFNWQQGPIATPNFYPMAAKSASAKFMIPEDPSNALLATPLTNLNNRWHRILDLLEVPSRTNVNLGIGTDLGIPRVPGRMNLNTLRHGENLAALLDDSRIMTLDVTNPVPPDADAPKLNDVLEPATRDWWQQFLSSRDAVDPYTSLPANGGLILPVPGLANSKPFRSLGFMGNNVVSGSAAKHPTVADTIFRPLPIDAAATTKRNLLEIGTALDHQNGVVDPYIRNRLLSKIAGNSTTRSNCFAVFISAKYFAAYIDSTAPSPALPSVRIGGPLNGTPKPEHRGFFIVDRSKIESGQTSKGPTFDFRSFVDYRITLETQ